MLKGGHRRGLSSRLCVPLPVNNEELENTEDRGAPPLGEFYLNYFCGLIVTALAAVSV